MHFIMKEIIVSWQSLANLNLYSRAKRIINLLARSNVSRFLNVINHRCSKMMKFTRLRLLPTKSHKQFYTADLSENEAGVHIPEIRWSMGISLILTCQKNLLPFFSLSNIDSAFLLLYDQVLQIRLVARLLGPVWCINSQISQKLIGSVTGA